MRTRILRRSVAALLCAVAVGGAMGCGGDDDGDAEETAQALVDARNEGDSERFCELMSDEVRASLGGENCPAFIDEQSSGAETEFELTEVQEDGDRAVAEIKATTDEGGTTREAQLNYGLRREDGEWRVAALGPPAAD